MLLGSGLERWWHHCRAHRFFALARWSADQLGLTQCDLAIRLLLPVDAALTITVDDTLFKRTGRKVFGAAWQHDGAAKSPKTVEFDTCFVVAEIVLDLPLSGRPMCLPVLARLWRPATPGSSPSRARWPSASPPAHTGKPGRSRTRGERLGTASDLAGSATWRTAVVRPYGHTDTVHLTDIRCLWHGVFHTQTVRVILVRDGKPRTADRDERGYGLQLVTTDLICTCEDLVAHYTARWGIETAFADARQVLGADQDRNRTRLAVERTVPFTLVCYGLVILWYTRHDHAPQDAAEHKARSRWYTTKTESSFDDMTTIKLRRVIIAARFPTQAPTSHNPKRPGPCSWPGPQQRHDQPELRKTSARTTNANGTRARATSRHCPPSPAAASTSCGPCSATEPSTRPRSHHPLQLDKYHWDVISASYFLRTSLPGE